MGPVLLQVEAEPKSVTRAGLQSVLVVLSSQSRLDGNHWFVKRSKFWGSPHALVLSSKRQFQPGYTHFYVQCSLCGVKIVPVYTIHWRVCHRCLTSSVMLRLLLVVLLLEVVVH